MQKKNLGFNYSLILFLYFVFSIILCSGQIFDLFNVIFGPYGDTRGLLYSAWRLENPEILGPLEFQNNFPDFIPILSILGMGLTKIFGYIGGHNFGIFISFPLTAFFTFIVFQKLTKSILISFLLGTIFGFTPFSVMHAFNGHPFLAFNLLIPIFFLFMYLRVFSNNKRLINTLFISITLLLMTFTNPYYAFFTSLIIFYFFIYECISLDKNKYKYKSVFTDYSLIILIPVFIFIVINYSFIYDVFFLDTSLGEDKVLNRSFSDMMIFSSRPWQFFIPSIDNYFFGDFFTLFSRKLLFGSNVVEQTYYLGLALIYLCILSVYYYFKNIFNEKDKKVISCFLFLCVFIFFMTFPPVILFFNFQTPTLNYLIYDFFPMFRVLSRFNIFLIFILIIISSFSLKYLFLRNKKNIFAIFSILMLVTIFEFLFISNDKITKVEDLPAAYSSINTEDNLLIAEYPFVEPTNFHHYDYLMSQYSHKMRILNGFPLNSIENIQFFNDIQDLSKDLTYKKLNDLGVTYIVVHNDKLKEGIIPKSIEKYFSIELGARLFEANIPLIVNKKFIKVYQDHEIQIFKL